MRQLPTLRFLGDQSSRRSGYDGEIITPRHPDDETTFVRRLSYKISEPSEDARRHLTNTIARERKHGSAFFFLDTNMWDVTIENELWDALIACGRNVVVIPQVKAELGNWMASHSEHKASQALLAKPNVFTLLELPAYGTATWDSYAYYVSLLGVRRQLPAAAKLMFERTKGRPPSKDELLGHMQSIGGDRALRLAYKDT